MKGGKVGADKLSASLSKLLLEYMYGAYKSAIGSMAKGAPIWICLGNHARGKALTNQSIVDICKARLGVSKVHALRHAFAHEMIAAGAPLSALQSRLGHSSLATTGIYATELNKADNPYADNLAAQFGI